MNRREALAIMASPLAITTNEEPKVFGYFVTWDLRNDLYNETVPGGKSGMFEVQKLIVNYDNEKAIRTNGQFLFNYSIKEVDAKAEAEAFAQMLSKNNEITNIKIVELHAKII